MSAVGRLAGKRRRAGRKLWPGVAGTQDHREKCR